MCCWICISLCVPSLTKGQQLVSGYADSLFSAGDYHRAALEYERIVFLNENAVVKGTAVLRKADCLKRLHEYREAQQYLERHYRASAPDSLRYEQLYQTALNAYLGENFNEAYFKLVTLSNLDSSRQRQKDILLLQILSLNELRKWKEADSIFRHMIALYAPGYDAADIYADIPKLKDPDKAEKLSTLLPFTGAGLIYAGKTGEGLLSAALQLGFIGFGGYCFLSHYYFTAVFIGVGGYASFYQGGIRRSKTLAIRYNEKKSTAFNTTARNQLLRLYRQVEQQSQKSPDH